MLKNLLVISILLLVLTSCDSNEIYVSPQGNQTSSGTKSDPLSFVAGINHISKLLKEKRLPKDGIKINVLGGVYQFDRPIVLSKEFKGTREAPITIQAVVGENVLFDGSMLIDSEKFNTIKNRKKTPLTKSAIDKIMVADGFLTLEGTSFVKVIGLSVKNVGSGSVYKITGDHNLIASAKISNSTAIGVDVSGNSNRVKGCDLIDLDTHVKLDGGVRSPNEIIPGYNVVENCHIYQNNFKHKKVNITLKGVSNTFRNNLIHNSLGRSMVVKGNDHIIEYNELFNIGFDEGDGGAIYSGGDLGGFGNIYRYNFFHHLIPISDKVECAGLHLDDGQSGATCVGNVFYKSASKGISMCGGAGHTLKENVFLEGDRGAYFATSLGNEIFQIQKEIKADLNHPRRGTKEDYIGRVEAYTGEKGWANSPWKEKYPLMNTILSDTLKFGRFWPIHHTIENNFYYNNKKSFDEIIDYRVDSIVVTKSSIKNNKCVSMNDFVDYENMSFKFKNEMKYPNIPFDEIGLYIDEYRSEMPKKEHYRKAIKRFYEGISNGDSGVKKRFNSAKIVEE
ncbi:right-handed parallel beta-helix repeat-containing protein [Flavivirga abyssicola]|uniref:right-handed parallel beta-helix repeat-containing protein n=1 Tax=Flavivirga abyssicola TaxID=3063533 RepID=UPI0026DF847F|nr:right-handed parallel beta-helix repeat-containing protein [Flavivirga sp. MEBiC07777]WVK14935.1 right-handed parallel beta-helix repeat-containing protein [Flavivirga sp. MEBiC07777]